MTSPDRPETPDAENARLRMMLAHAEEMNELEKLQLARTLHNEFGSALTALAMRMAVLARQPAGAETDTGHSECCPSEFDKTVKDASGSSKGFAMSLLVRRRAVLGARSAPAFR